MTPVGYYHLVPRFSLGGNDNYGDCVFVTQSNYTDLRTAVAGTPQWVDEAEPERWYAEETGWTAANPDSDKGEVLEKMLQFWRDHGNPSDPIDRITAYWPVTDIPVAIEEYGACFSWAMLPAYAGGTDDLSGDGGDGVDAHAMLIVGATDDSLTVATWGELRTVSRDWWRKYGRDTVAVSHPAWLLVAVFIAVPPTDPRSL